MTQQDMQFLGSWEQIEAPGMHSQRFPAELASGYSYTGSRIPTQSYIAPMPVQVKRNAPNWGNSPQVRFWLEEPKRTVGQRIRDWLKKDALR